MLSRSHRTVALGGTFEQLHRGHQKLILRALQIGDRVVIGLTSDTFTSSLMKNHYVSRYESRLEGLKALLSRMNSLERVTIVPLSDPYGPAASDGAISGIVVSHETLRTTLEINRIRLQNKIKPLEIYVVNFVLDEDGNPISSTSVSSGLICRNGRLLRGGT